MPGLRHEHDAERQPAPEQRERRRVRTMLAQCRIERPAGQIAMSTASSALTTPRAPGRGISLLSLLGLQGLACPQTPRQPRASSIVRTPRPTAGVCYTGQRRQRRRRPPDPTQSHVHGRVPPRTSQSSAARRDPCPSASSGRIHGSESRAVPTARRPGATGFRG